MFNGYDLLAIENEIYNTIIEILNRNNVPVDVAYILMEAVCKKISDGAYFDVINTIRLMQNPTVPKDADGASAGEGQGGVDVVDGE